MQLDHAILLPASRERLRHILESLPGEGSPTPTQYRALMDLFFGTGATQQEEDRLYHHRERILRPLSAALSVRCLDECGDPPVLALYLRTLLDNQWIMLERALSRLLSPSRPCRSAGMTGTCCCPRRTTRRSPDLSPSPP